MRGHSPLEELLHGIRDLGQGAGLLLDEELNFLMLSRELLAEVVRCDQPRTVP